MKSRSGSGKEPAPADGKIAVLLDILDAAFERKSWHGTNLRGALRGLSEEDASWRPERGRHNIWELALHAAYWKYAVRRRIAGEKRGGFPIEGSNWWVRPDPSSPAGWKSDLEILVLQHRKLREAVETLTAGDLVRRAGGSGHSMEEMIYGVAAHDLYHTGQIQLIKRLRRD